MAHWPETRKVSKVTNLLTDGKFGAMMNVSLTNEVTSNSRATLYPVLI
jgi:hypothetical protein